MKQLQDTRTLSLPGVAPPKRPRGRPPTGNALSGAERQKARRERLKAAGVETLTVEISSEVAEKLRAFVQFKDGTRVDDVIEKLLRTQFLRKR